jgi:hypothetical protein
MFSNAEFNGLKTLIGWQGFKQYLQGKPEAIISPQQMKALVYTSETLFRLQDMQTPDPIRDLLLPTHKSS